MVSIPTVCHHVQSTGTRRSLVKAKLPFYIEEHPALGLASIVRSPYVTQSGLCLMSAPPQSALYSSRDRWDEARSAYYKALQEGRIRRGWNFSPLARSIPAKSRMASVLKEAVETGDWRAAHYALYGMQEGSRCSNTGE